MSRIFTDLFISVFFFDLMYDFWYNALYERENMKYRFLCLTVMFLFAPTFVYGACSVANLTRCLDSVCAINIGANPAARCQYCGSSSAGTPVKSSSMRSVSAGTSTKYTISDKELKKAPSDPGQRYIWGTKLCLEKVSGCTPDDVTDNYDSLIEQSCKAAGISAEFANLAKKTNTTKTQTNCSGEIEVCMVNTKRCNANYKNCQTDSDFDKYFSECSIISSGCESFLADIKQTIAGYRKTSLNNAAKLLSNIVAAYQSNREQRLSDAQNSCKNNKAFNDCVNRVCSVNMRNKCDIGFEYEKTVATELCKFYDTACARLK